MTDRDKGVDDAGTQTEPAIGYPPEWEADVLLTDGSTAHLRPIRPDDQERLVSFYSRVSAESKYMRFFAPYPVLSDADVHRFTHVDYHDRVALILTIGDDMVAVGRYDRLNDGDAEVAFLVQDGMQGKGVAPILLEHLAEAGRERKLERFTAEILPQNRRMVQVFVDAGYTVGREFEDGMIMVEFPIRPTDKSLEVMERREHRAESTSVRRLLHPKRLAVVASQRRTALLIKQMHEGGYTGEIIAVPLRGGEVPGVPNAPSIDAIEGELDVVVTSVPVGEMDAVVRQAADKAFGLYVLVAGEFGGEQNLEIVQLVRAHGLRALGPDALGIINTNPEVSLNASPAPWPRPGRVGLFCQSSGVGVILMSTAIEQNVGIGTFISSGLWADVTSNDVMQYWMDDPETDVCLLSLDRIGNPRKFTRIARQLASRKPVVLFSPGRSQRDRNQGAAANLQNASEAAVDSMFRQSGIIVCNRRDAMYDVAQILARQPLPRGEHVHVVTNSPALHTHIERVARANGLLCDEPTVLSGHSPAEAYANAAREALADDTVDSVVVCIVDIFADVSRPAYAELSKLAAESTKPLLGVIADFIEVHEDTNHPDGPGQLPIFASYADAIAALAAVTAYGRWRERDHGEVVDFAVDKSAAQAIVQRILDETPQGRPLTGVEARELLSTYGINVAPRYQVETLDEAIKVAEEIGWNVVLKAADRAIRGRSDAPGVFRHLNSVHEMTQAWEDLGQIVVDLGLAEANPENPQLLAKPIVQQMMPTGVSLELRSREDPAFGPIISVGMAGLDFEALGDVAHRVPPLTSTDAHNMVRELRSARTLFGRDGAPPANIAAVEEMLQRLAQLADDIPQLAEVTLSPCIASTAQLSPVGCQVTVAPSANLRDALARSLG